MQYSYYPYKNNSSQEFPILSVDFFLLIHLLILCCRLNVFCFKLTIFLRTRAFSCIVYVVGTQKYMFTIQKKHLPST